MTQQTAGTAEELVMRSAEGAWYKIPAGDMEGYRMSEEEAARLEQQSPPIPEEPDVEGFQTTGSGTDTGYMYTWKGIYYRLIGVDPSFANL